VSKLTGLFSLLEVKMRVVFLFIAASMLIACARVETAPPESQPEPVASPTSSRTIIFPLVILKPVVPEVKLNSQQKRYLNDSLPPDARRILESAESFEVFGEINKDESSETDSREFVPNTVARVTSERRKKEILEAFYFDAAHEDAPAVCYEPHHSLKATAKGKTVEIEICFSCSRFVVNGIEKKAWGTIVREKRKSEDLLTRILDESGVEIDR
jgi:hypothetical protein